MLVGRSQWVAVNRGRGGGGGTHVGKLRYDVLALIVTVKPMASPKILGRGDHSLFVIGRIGGGFYESRGVVAFAAQQEGFVGPVRSLGSLVEAVGRQGAKGVEWIVARGTRGTLVGA